MIKPQTNGILNSSSEQRDTKLAARTNHDVPPANRLLSALPRNEYGSLLPELKPVTLALGQILYERGDTIRHVYFPNTSIIALLSTAEESAIEVGMVGNEGMAGISVFMGTDRASTQGLVHCGGSAVRMRTATMRKISKQAGSLHTLLLRYTYSLFSQVSQSSACSRFHTATGRLACSLLMTSDRMSSNGFLLTQDFLAKLLGTRRETVNKAAGSLQKEKIINYSRGVISILNRAALEESACTCYARLRESDTF
jgi:CRP-like cAMP-binding protein